jgi:SAM-dependent methyltransferase
MQQKVTRDGQEYYAHSYEDYELQTSPRKLRFYMSLVRRWVPPGSDLFELGVGMGHFLQRAAEHYVCWGSDMNGYGLGEARKRVPQATLFEGSFECIPARSAPAAVVSWDVLEHIENLDEALRCIRSRLGNPGFLIGVVPVYDGPLGWLVRLLDRDPTHVQKWPRAMWIHTLRHHGFDVVQCGGAIRRLLLSRYYLHVTWPQPLLRRIGSAFYFVARKSPAHPAPA